MVATGPGDAAGFAVGDRAGAAWLRSTDGTCRYCARGSENLCPASTYTGWDVDGGYAEYLTVPAAYAHPLPGGYSHAELAPLLCAGIIGYRALKRAALPPGGRLGLYGFGGSAHLAGQVALAQGATLYVMTRGEQAQELARSLGRHVRRRRGRHATGTTRRGHPLRARRRPGAARARRAGPRRHARDRRDLPDRHPATVLRPLPLPGTTGPQRHLQHPGGRPGVPRVRRRAPAVGHHARVPARRRRPRPGRPQGGPLRRRRRPHRRSPAITSAGSTRPASSPA